MQPSRRARAVHCAIRRQLAQKGAGPTAGSGEVAFWEATGAAAAAAAAPAVTADDLNEALRGFVPAPFWGVQQAAAAAGKVRALDVSTSSCHLGHPSADALPAWYSYAATCAGSLPTVSRRPSSFLFLFLCASPYVVSDPIMLYRVPAQAEGWEDVGGLRHVVSALREALLLPVRYRRLVAGAPLRLRTGALLYGPPGCGKTHVVSAAVAAVAKVANVR